MRRSRGGRRSQGSGPGDPGTALDYVNLSAVLAYHRADLGITLGTGVSAWADQSGNGHDFAQATGANQPAYSAGGGPNGTAIITGDGSNDILVNATLDLPPPGTTPTYTWVIMSTITWSIDRTVYGCPGGAFSAGLGLLMRGVTPEVLCYNGTVRTGLACPLGSWFRVATCHRNGTSGGDLTVVGSTSILNPSTGNNDPTIGRTIFGRSGATSCWNGSIAEILHLNAEPSASELSALNAYVAARYGGGLT